MKSLTPGLAVTNLGVSLTYYANALGFKVTLRVPGEDGRLKHAEIECGAARLMLTAATLHRVEETAARRVEEPTTLGLGVDLYFMIDDVDEFYLDLKDRDVVLEGPPETKYWGHRIVRCQDPDGYRLTFAQKVAEPSSAK